MICQRCNAQQAVEQDGHPAPCHLFGEIDGYFCPDCIVALQQPFEAALRRDIAERAPDLTAADLDHVPNQMLKFTLCLPIPRNDS